MLRPALSLPWSIEYFRMAHFKFFIVLLFLLDSNFANLIDIAQHDFSTDLVSDACARDYEIMTKQIKNKPSWLNSNGAWAAKSKK